jgi:ribosome biogenesis GTPase
VASVDRGRYGCLVDDEPVIAMKARELGRRAVVVGDRVALAGDVSGEQGTLARIVRVRPRTSVLRRSADDTDPVERVIVANADQLIIVCALANPPPRLRFIDRCLVAAYDAGLAPLLCLTKADLAAPDDVIAVYEPLGVPCVVTSRPFTDDMIAGLRSRLAGRQSVLIGHSGVGKSTLVNALIPEAGRAVGVVNPVTGRGRHTSSSAVALRLPDSVKEEGAEGRQDEVRGKTEAGRGGWVIDTPGLRSFGLGHVSPDRVVRAFPDLAEGAAQCPPGCTHLEESCTLDDWAAAHGAEARLDSLRRLLRSREGADT